MNYEDIIAVLEWEDKCDKERHNENDNSDSHNRRCDIICAL